MKISATVRNAGLQHSATVSTEGNAQSVATPAEAGGRGSAVNGGEFLMLALATCYCNDIYREANRLGIVVEEVEVEANADFEGVGLAASNVSYRARVRSPAAPAQIERLLKETDAVAEVHNTLRQGVPVSVVAWP